MQTYLGTPARRTKAHERGGGNSDGHLAIRQLVSYIGASADDLDIAAWDVPLPLRSSKLVTVRPRWSLWQRLRASPFLSH